jgi:hypothetical protein
VVEDVTTVDSCDCLVLVILTTFHRPSSIAGRSKMKKLIAAVFAAVLMAAGLVAATGSTASANCNPSTYSGCIATVTKAKVQDSVKQGNTVRVCGKVKAVGSTVKPNGKLVFIVKSTNGFFQKESAAYPGGPKVCTETRALKKKGGYTLTVKYKSPSGSVFRNSTGTNTFDVV